MQRCSSRASATKRRTRARRLTLALHRPAPLPHRRIPLVSRIHPPTQSRSDSVIAAIAEITAAKAIAYIRNFASSWAKAKPPTKAMMVQSLYEEIVVRGRSL